MISIGIDNRQLERLAKTITGSSSQLPKAIAKAINDTAKKTTSDIAKSISKEIAVTQKVVKAQMKQGKANANNLSSSVTLKKSARISLRDFKAKQNKTGVAYTISKQSGRKTIAGAFQGPKPGAMKASWRGNVFKRAGASRLPIVKLFGPSPWGVFDKQNMTPQQVKDTDAELRKQIERQIREVSLRNSGIIKSK